jgi:hypothetical protein
MSIPQIIKAVRRALSAPGRSPLISSGESKSSSVELKRFQIFKSLSAFAGFQHASCTAAAVFAVLAGQGTLSGKKIAREVQSCGSDPQILLFVQRLATRRSGTSSL